MEENKEQEINMDELLQRLISLNEKFEQLHKDLTEGLNQLINKI
jgi:hypothetical protein